MVRPTLCPQRATNHLDYVVPLELGSEGFIYRHGHHGLLAPLHAPVSLPCSTTKDAFRPPHRIPLLAQGAASKKGRGVLGQWGDMMLRMLAPHRAARSHAGEDAVPEVPVSLWDSKRGPVLRDCNIGHGEG